MPRPNSEPKQIKATCPKCGGERNCYVRAKYTKDIPSSGNDPTAAADTHYILECCGCGRCFVRREYWFSEWDYVDSDEYGRLVMVPGIQVSQWPATTARAKPAWVDSLRTRDETLFVLLNEMYSAVDNELPILASIALRTTFDRAAELLGVDPSYGFDRKLEELCKSGKIGQHEQTLLDVLTNAGSAAAHRGWCPTLEQLDTLFSIIETFLHRSLVLGHEAEKIRATVPTRPKRSKTN